MARGFSQIHGIDFDKICACSQVCVNQNNAYA
jgi:hypothetical protein